jgi:hypothetical protein
LAADDVSADRVEPSVDRRGRVMVAWCRERLDGHHRFVAASQSSCADVLRPVGATPLTAWIFPSTKSF